MRFTVKISILLLCVFWCGSSVAWATEALRLDNVLVSKENIPPLNGYFAARQDVYRIGHVLVSAPNQSDVSMLAMLQDNGITTLEEYARWLQENISYKKDEGVDTWSLPEETLVRKYGDCEDFAFFSASVLSVLGYHPKVLGLRGVHAPTGNLIGNHAICVFEKNGNFFYFDNGKLKLTDAASIEQFSNYMFTRYRCASISELTFLHSDKEEKTLFTRYVQAF